MNVIIFVMNKSKRQCLIEILFLSQSYFTLIKPYTIIPCELTEDTDLSFSFH